ncbi:histidine kinase [Finegoldia magna]|uniref:histidine kinase n=1 Tax=Finegoldia magna TaxID=1260 RepID=UPI0029089474|nr:histidine kinase [Finegoldia magna]MDU5201167.1 histidine kinase [Finegoldia magna]MDU6776224.1 histidine kinase [Finegoldia magna]
MKTDVEERFGKGKNFLVAMKHNGVIKSGLELLISGLLYTLDNNRTFVLVIDKKGIYEKEISNSDNTGFYLMPENEIQNFEVNTKSNKAYISFNHVGKKISYEIPFTGRIFKDNKTNFKKFESDNWFML